MKVLAAGADDLHSALEPKVEERTNPYKLTSVCASVCVLCTQHYNLYQGVTMAYVHLCWPKLGQCLRSWGMKAENHVTRASTVVYEPF